MDALRPEWRRRSLVDQLGIIFAELFRKIGDCRSPIQSGPMVAPLLFACWTTITDLRIEKPEWVFASDDPGLRQYFEIASRNVSRARMRLTLEESRRQTGSDYLPQDERARLSMNHPMANCFPVLGPTWNASPNPTTPERDPQSPPPPQSRVPKFLKWMVSRMRRATSTFPNDVH